MYNLKSFAFYGDQLFGVDMESKQYLYHWDVSDLHNNFEFDTIELDILSDDLDLDDSMYPVRLEVQNGYLYLFQRFEQQKGIEVSKISFFDNQIEETGIGWLYHKGHESLFNHFDAIHGFIFDAQMKKYFMFSDCELIIENNTAANSADFYIDSDLKFKFNDND